MVQMRKVERVVDLSNEIMGSFPIWSIVKDEIDGGDAVKVKGSILHCHGEKMTVDLHLLVIV